MQQGNDNHGKYYVIYYALLLLCDMMYISNTCLNHFTVFYINRVQRLPQAQVKQRPLLLEVLQLPLAQLEQRPLQLRVLQLPLK